MRTPNVAQFQRGHAANVLGPVREARFDALEAMVEDAIRTFEAAQAGQCEASSVLDRIRGISAASQRLLHEDLFDLREAH